MKLTSKQANEMLQSFKGKTQSDRWIGHSIGVGNAAGKIAKALQEKGHLVDVDKAIALGYVHDIGKYTGESKGHVTRGYEYLRQQGYDEDYCNVCLTHSYMNHDVI